MKYGYAGLTPALLTLSLGWQKQGGIQAPFGVKIPCKVYPFMPYLGI